MIEWLISSAYMVLLSMILIVVAVVIYLRNHEFREEPSRFLKYLTRFTVLLSLTFFITSSQIETKPVSSSEWTTVYQNKSGIDVSLEYTDGKLVWDSRFSFESGHRLGDGYDRFKSDFVATMIVSKNGFEESKEVFLDRRNVISDSEITENSKIVKIEYRKVDYYDRKLKNYHGRMPATDVAEYEVRVTLKKDTTTQKEIDELLDQ